MIVRAQAAERGAFSPALIISGNTLDQRVTTSNRLLRALSPDDRALLEPYLEPREFKKKDVLILPDKPMDHVYFLDRGLASIVAKTHDNRKIEVGIYGRDGMGSTAAVLGDAMSSHEHFIQIEGAGFRLPIQVMVEAFRKSPSMQAVFLRYVRVFQLQVEQTAQSNGNYNLPERLARWLLMCHDRIDGDELPITHQFLGIMLAVRRSGVTLTVQTIEGTGIIKAKRGCIIIRDRAKLEQIAGG